MTMRMGTILSLQTMTQSTNLGTMSKGRICVLVSGDWYYTTYFGPPEDRVFQSPNIDGLTPQQWQDRKDVLTAHLDNLPETM